MIARCDLPEDARAWVAAGRFQELEDYAEKARAENLAEKHLAHPMLCAFYESLCEFPKEATDAAWLDHLGHMEKWRAAFPRSITPRVALMSFWIGYAWKARGSGWAREVTDEGWEGFRERLPKARAVFEEAEALPTKDPELYALAITLAMGQSSPREEMEEFFRKGVEISPYYVGLYYRKRYYLAQKWHGGPGDWQEFAREAADKMGGEMGDMLYAQLVYEGMTEERNVFKPTEEDPSSRVTTDTEGGLTAWAWDLVSQFLWKVRASPAADYARVKQGALATIGYSLEKWWPRSQLAYAACLAGDRATALSLMCQFADQRAQKYWEDDAEWERRLAWADGEGRIARARACEERGEWEEAEKLYTSLAVPPDENRLLGLSRYRHGRSLEWKGRFEDAEQVYLAISEKCAIRPKALKNLSFHFAKADRVADFMAEQRAGWTSETATPEKKYDLMLDYLLLRDFDQARAFGAAFNKERPWNLNGYGALYAIALQQGDEAAARDLRARVLALKTDRKAYLYAQALMRGEKVWNGPVPELDPKDKYFRQSVFMIALDYQYQKKPELRDAILEYAMAQVPWDRVAFPNLETQQLASLLFGALKFKP